jgi:hypothetical protein
MLTVKYYTIYIVSQKQNTLHHENCGIANTNIICSSCCVFFIPDVYDSGRRDKPSVLVTSPGSPDFHIPARAARPPRLGSSPTNSNVGGRLQVSMTSSNSKSVNLVQNTQPFCLKLSSLSSFPLSASCIKKSY